MRINKFIALATGLSRRAADDAIREGKVKVNEVLAEEGQQVEDNDVVVLNGDVIKLAAPTSILLNKPAGYVVSREGQGAKTVYELLPDVYQNLKPAGRLDKDSSGLLIMTNDGGLAYRLTHPSFQKEKVYEIELDKPLGDMHREQVENGIDLDDGKSTLKLSGKSTAWIVTMHEGRNRQIRRTFSALGYSVVKLQRVQFGPYKLGALTEGEYLLLDVKYSTI